MKFVRFELGVKRIDTEELLACNRRILNLFRQLLKLAFKLGRILYLHTPTSDL